MVRELVLHIGLAKTGSSALQSFLLLNKKILMDNYSTLFPGETDNHFHLQSMVSSHPEELIQIRRAGIFDHLTAVLFAHRWKASVSAEIAMSSSRRVVFSSEYLTSASDDELSQIFQFLASICDNIKILAYVRDPWSFSTAILQQAVKDGLMRAPIVPGYAGGNIEILDRMMKVSGIKPTVRPYIGGRIRNFDIISDFLNYLAIDFTDQFTRQTAEMENSSLSYEAACILSSFNARYPAVSESGLYINDHARDWASGILTALHGTSTLSISKRRAECIYEESFDDIDRLQREYLDGEQVYWDAYENMTFSDSEDTVSIDSLPTDLAYSSLMDALYQMAEKAILMHKWAVHSDAEVVRLRELFDANEITS